MLSDEVLYSDALSAGLFDFQLSVVRELESPNSDGMLDVA